ncbi:SEC14 domain and spectrin repeat-containing protein 1-B [Euwallacea similis]|uniref:SEC14 domain and spectrin repeat-containing protein 1-B n=1 Tax=Euwallacea similis TaxID=1736056 RepID=UPI00344DC068
MDEKPELSCLQGNPSVSLPGGVDKEGRPLFLVTVPPETASLQITAPVKYLLSIFSEATKKSGFTLVLDARKGAWRASRGCIKQVLGAFAEGQLKRLIVLKPDGFWDKQRVENCTTPQPDQEVLFIPRSRLNRFVEQSQLPVELGGGLIYSHEKWMENRQRVEEFYKDAEVTVKELEDLRQHVIRSKALRASQVEEAINTSCDMEEATQMLVYNVIETGKELVQNIEYENRTRKLSIENIDKIITPQDTLDTIERIHSIVNDIRQRQQEIEAKWSEMEKSLSDTKDLNELKKAIVKVTNWILGPAEQLMNLNHKVGYDVASAEELRREHEAVEIQCVETYGKYAELLHRIRAIEGGDNLSAQQQDLLSQKEFMDFVCKSFAFRVEKRRNILITSLRFFRLVSEYFDKTGEVFDSLVMDSSIIDDFDRAAVKLAELRDNQLYLDSIEHELRREGEKLSDMLSMPIKDALGQEVTADYSEDIVNIHDVLDATVARKNIFSDSVELQKVTLQQITLIDRYETDAHQANNWLEDILSVMLKDHGHVGCTVSEIQSQKDEHQMFQETAKCTYNYGSQLLNASLQLRHSCKLPLNSHNKLYHALKNNWQRIHSISQEQMTRLRVSAVFHRSVEDHCNQLRDLREAVATIPVLNLSRKRQRIQQYFQEREKLMVEVGRMVRLGRLLRSRLKEPLYEEESFFTPLLSPDHPLDEFYQLCQDSIKNNEISIEIITEKLLEVTQLSEELDQALKSAQEDCIVFSTVPTSSTIISSEINNNCIFELGKSLTMDEKEYLFPPDAKKTDDQLRSDEEFLTASDTTLQHSRSSSYNTASECEQHFASWWQHGKDDMRENTEKEKMVLAVGCPPGGELPPSKEVLKSSPAVPPGKIVREVTETTHFKVQQQHNLGVKSFVLTSEIVKEKGAEASSTREETIKYRTDDGREVSVRVEKDNTVNPEDVMARMNEVGLFEADDAWSNYSSYRNVTQQTIKKFMLS